MKRPVSSDSSPRCLTEEEALAFASGRLSAEERERAHGHLDACDDCQLLLNEAVGALATARAVAEPRLAESGWGTAFRPGMVLGRYEIRRFIARGGMGEVYEAFDLELNERVALKTVASTVSDDPSAVRRLKAEVQLARRVSHPNVCRIYDFGSHRGTGPASVSFLTMEFVEGETLGERLRRDGALAVEQAVALARSLLGGLRAAHEAGVLHRDFKSDNVLLRPDGARLEPLILDFGLARARDSVATHSSGNGRTLVGTLAYLAPEQLEGKPHTCASDVYSFGLVWFEMLTGKLPFRARSSPAVTTLDRLTKPVPAPSSVNPLVPSQLDAVVLACLRRNPRERLPTPAEVLARLDELERQAPATSGKSRASAAIAGVAVLATAGLVLAATRLLMTPPAVATIHSSVRARVPAESQGASVMSHPPPSILSSQPPPVAVLPSASARVTKAPRAEPAKRTPLAGDPPLLRSSAPPSNADVPGRPSGWENPFADASRASAKLGAVLDQSLERRPPPGDAELAESSR